MQMRQKLNFESAMVDFTALFCFRSPPLSPRVPPHASLSPPLQHEVLRYNGNLILGQLHWTPPEDRAQAPVHKRSRPNSYDDWGCGGGRPADRGGRGSRGGKGGGKGAAAGGKGAAAGDKGDHMAASSYAAIGTTVGVATTTAASCTVVHKCSEPGCSKKHRRSDHH